MQLNELSLHSHTLTQLLAVIEHPPQALLLSGEKGVGTLTAASVIAQGISSHVAFVTVVSPNEQGTITIASIRELYVQTRTKSEEKKVIIIDNADTMGIEAQNAFLKLLEEPNKHVIFILTTHRLNALLDTVQSRLQTIRLKNISSSLSLNFLIKNAVTDPKLQSQLLFLGKGLPAELYRLVHDTNYRDRALQYGVLAKQLIIGNRYEQIKTISVVASLPRDDVQSVVNMAERMLQSQLIKEQTDTVLQKIDALLRAQEKIAANGHIRTQLLRTIS